MRKKRSQVGSVIAIGAGLSWIPGIALANTYNNAGGLNSQAGTSPSYVNIDNVNITDNQNYLVLNLNLNPSANVLDSDGSQTYGRYLIGFQTGAAGTGDTSTVNDDPYGVHSIGSSQGLNYYVESWTDDLGSGMAGQAGYTLFNYAASTWTAVAGETISQNANNSNTYNPVINSAGNALTYFLPLYAWSPGGVASGSSATFNGLTFNFDVYTTFDGNQSVYDALSAPASVTTASSWMPWNNPSYDSASPSQGLTAYESQVYTLLNWNNTGTGGGTGTTWNNSANNWGGGGSVPVAYADGDNVLFADNNNGNYNVTLSSTVAPASVVFGNSAGNYTISGSGGISGSGFLTVNGTDTVTLATANTYTGGTNVNSGTLIIAPTSTANAVALPNGAVTIGATGKLQLADNASASSPFTSSSADISNQLMQISSLSITSGGIMDIRNNHFYVADPGGAPDDATFQTLLSYVSTGAVTSSEGDGGYGIGIVDGNDGVSGTKVSANQIEIAYTLDGDANLDGKVDITDFNIFAPNFGSPTTLGWEAGDFGYFGNVNITDFNLFAGNFGASDSGTAVSMPAADYAALHAFMAANGLTLSSVPEPASVGLLAMGAVGILSRRRRINK